MAEYVAHLIVIIEHFREHVLGEPVVSTKYDESYQLRSFLFRAHNALEAREKAVDNAPTLEDRIRDDDGGLITIRCFGIHNVEMADLFGETLEEALNGDGVGLGHVTLGKAPLSIVDRQALLDQARE